MSKSLFDWYGQHGRDFPWRSTRDPWAILVSEVMSQQTQIDRVATRYPVFLIRFPTPQALADATPADVLREWSGLGYNRRALNLRAAAAEIAASGWPRTAAHLETLPGIGPYTAAAVACFAFGEQVAAVDTNLKRVLSRWVGRPLSGKELGVVANQQMPAGEAMRWNSALMDLGAAVCQPTPLCDRCPVSDTCADPSVYLPPPRQQRFDGSVRQTRGAIVKLMLDGGPRTLAELHEETGHDAKRVDAALASLAADRVLVESNGAYAVADT